MIVSLLLDNNILISDDFNRSFYTYGLLTIVVLTLACIIITLFIYPYKRIFTLVVFSASLSHVLLDILTIMGVPCTGHEITHGGTKNFQNERVHCTLSIHNICDIMVKYESQ